MNCFLRGLEPSDLNSLGQTDSFLQSGFWGTFKAVYGWKALPFTVHWNDDTSSSLLVLCQRIVMGLSFAYVPWGPELNENLTANDEEHTNALAELAAAIKKHLPKNTILIRFDVPWFTEGVNSPPPLIEKPFVKSYADIQPPDTVLINLTQSEEELFSSMKSKWRYNSRLALKKGVTISQPDEAGIETFYALLKETSIRDGIALRGKDYYQTLFSHCNKPPEENSKQKKLRLYIAEHEGEAIASIIVLLWGDKATYLYGASSNNKRNLMAPYALQTKGMFDAKNSLCTEYDLFGIPPNDDPSHPMAGLYQFKTGFGGKIIHRPGSYDFLYGPLAARAFRIVELIRKKTRDRKKRKNPQ